MAGKMDFLLKIRNESECLEKIARLEGDIQGLEGEKFIKDRMISELNSKFSDFETEREKEIKVLKDQKLEKEKIISELNEKLSKLETEILQKNQRLGMYEKVQSFKLNTWRFEQEIRDLQDQNFMKDQMIYDLNVMLSRMHNDIMEKDWVLGTYQEQVMFLKGQIFTDGMKVLQSKADEEKNKMTSDFNEKMSKLNCQLQEKDQIIGTYEKKLKCLDEKGEEVQREIQTLKGQNLMKDQIISELNDKQHKLQNEILDNDLIVVTFEENVKFYKTEVGLLEQEIQDLKSKSYETEVGLLESEIQDLKSQKLIVDQRIEQMISELSIAAVEKSTIIGESEEKMCKLKHEISKRDVTIGKYDKKMKSFEEKVKKEIQGLRGQILKDNKMIDEMISGQSISNDKKNKMISELNDEIGKLKNQLLEKDHVIQVLKDQKSVDDQTIKKLKDEQVISAQMVQKMKCRELAARQTFEKMKCIQSKANASLEELSLQKLTASKIVEDLRRQLWIATKNAGNVSDSKGENQSLKEDDVRIVVSKMNTMPSAFNVAKRPRSSLWKMGCKIQREESGKNQHKAVLQAGYSPKASTCMDTKGKCKRWKRTDPIEEQKIPPFTTTVSPNSCSGHKRKTSFSRALDSESPLKTGPSTIHLDSAADSEDEAYDESSINELLDILRIKAGKCAEEVNYA